MKTLIYHHAESSGFNDDDYYYLILDENSGTLTVEHSWHYWRPSGVDRGERQMTFEELKQHKPGIYRMTIEQIEAKLFS